ncbi:MAG: DUF2796 domain-containing protein [Pseudomonadota bacterium]
MPISKVALTSALFATTALFTVAQADEKRELSAHVHGHSTLNIAVEGTEVAMEFIAPGADIVGFEHAATSDEDRAAITAAKTTLGDPLGLFVMPASAECTLQTAAVELVTEGADHDDHGHGKHGHDEHGHDEHSHDKHDHEEHASEEHSEGEHGHAEEAAHSDHDHDKHDHDNHEHAHDNHADEADGGHTEFHATYALNCANPSALTEITFALFERFPNAEEVDMTLISAAGQYSAEVERDEPRVDLSGRL